MRETEDGDDAATTMEVQRIVNEPHSDDRDAASHTMEGWWYRAYCNEDLHCARLIRTTVSARADASPSVLLTPKQCCYCNSSSWVVSFGR